MKLLYLLIAALPLSMACKCVAPVCPSSQPAKCECENKAALKCAKACRNPIRPFQQDCSKATTEPQICGSLGLEPCPSDRPFCVNTPDQLANGCTIAADCPGFCVALGGFCGGFAGFSCPGKDTCVDDPRDDCSVENGGADCGGVCVNFDGFPTPENPSS